MQRTYYLGKNEKVKGSAKNKGVPNTNVDVRDCLTGEIYVRHKVGADGHFYKDYNVAEKPRGKHSDKIKEKDHKHMYDGLKRKKRASPLNKKEQAEFNKAKRKRKVWKP